MRNLLGAAAPVSCGGGNDWVRLQGGLQQSRCEQAETCQAWLCSCAGPLPQQESRSPCQWPQCSWPLGWSLLSGGGSINPWEAVDQLKKGSGNLAVYIQIQNLMLFTAGLRSILLCSGVESFCEYLEMWKRKAGSQFVVCACVSMRACFAQSC